MVHEISPVRAEKARRKDNRLEKLPDKYIYNISYHTTFEDIDRFEIDNQVSVFVIT